jgi:hypothetical protein
MAFSKARRLANLMSTASDTVPASKVNTVLADDAVTTAKIADDAITTALIADDAVTADHLANSINSAITANTAKVTNAITTHTGDVTGGAALTIAVDAVDIPMLSASGSPSSTTFLRGDNEWAAVPAGVDIQSSAPSVASEGSLYYNTTTDKLYLSNGTVWQPIDTNAPPVPTGGTVTIPTFSAGSTFSYNLGLNFTDELPDAELTYTLESGTLPAGAVLPTAGNTALTGTATIVPGAITYNFVIRATDAKAAFATQAYTQIVTSTAGSGGTINTTGGYRYHVFTSSGNFVLTAGGAFEYLIVAGGGAGGSRHGGGGGGGGYLTSTITATAQTYSLVVGAGGVGVEGSGTIGTNGSNTSAFGLTSIGGGAGGSFDSSTIAQPTSGGSGGGCGYFSNTVAAGTSGQGNAGGAHSMSNTYVNGGGGGGKGAVGGTAAGNQSGDGGAGLQFGDGYYYSGGGGAGTWTAGYAGDGGIGGGGGGNAYSGYSGAVGTGGGSARNSGGAGTVLYNNSTLTPGGAGGANTGGGGGSADQSGYSNYRGVGGNGGSGIVIIRYAA